MYQGEDEGKDYVVYQNTEKKYFNYTPLSNYQWWAKKNPKDRKFYPILARGLTIEQAQAMVRLTREEK